MQTEAETGQTAQTAAAAGQTPQTAAQSGEKTGITVYYTPSGSVLHYDPDCSYLKNASKVLSCDKADAPDRPACSRCGPH